ncbi:hypothetical protein [Kitasatospora sp. LaBMicrA B282]|uniref:restriction endonuclease-related protein n=1 Tax=Kitasatospora sp. LaBMicrA B282 TaxID=3420949 RepID=UPI003D0DD583
MKFTSAAEPVSHDVIRQMVMRAATVAAKALTDTEQSAEGRLRTLMDSHGEVLAARGPGHPLTFESFMTMLADDLAGLLPDGVSPEEMAGVHLINDDGLFEEDLFDLDQEQREVARAVQKATQGGRSTSLAEIEQEMDQVTVNSGLRKRGTQEAYAKGRADLSRMPAGTEAAVRRLNLPSVVGQYYRPVSFAALYEQWWFACPVCRWPMKVTRHRSRKSASGRVQCFYRPHAELMGASYTFKIPAAGKPPTLIPGSPPPAFTGAASVLAPDLRGPVPKPMPSAGYVALARGPWRYTTIPGLLEIALYDALIARGFAAAPESHMSRAALGADDNCPGSVTLWPFLDTYDLHVDVWLPDGRTQSFQLDVKDFTSEMLLAKKIQADGGDVGGAEWIVVPDHREASLPLLRGVCEEFSLKVATAGEVGQTICRTAGIRWA